MAEWLGSALQKLLHRFESGSDLKNKRLTFSTLVFFYAHFFSQQYLDLERALENFLKL